MTALINTYFLQYNIVIEIVIYLLEKCSPLTLLAVKVSEITTELLQMLPLGTLESVPVKTPGCQNSGCFC